MTLGSPGSRGATGLGAGEGDGPPPWGTAASGDAGRGARPGWAGAGVPASPPSAASPAGCLPATPRLTCSRFGQTGPAAAATPAGTRPRPLPARGRARLENHLHTQTCIQRGRAPGSVPRPLPPASRWACEARAGPVPLPAPVPERQGEARALRGRTRSGPAPRPAVSDPSPASPADGVAWPFVGRPQPGEQSAGTPHCAPAPSLGRAAGLWRC